MAETKAISPDTILSLLALAGQYGPVVLEMVQKLVETLKRQPMMAAGGHCPHEHTHACCEAAIEHQVQALAHLLACKECCKP